MSKLLEFHSELKIVEQYARRVTWVADSQPIRNVELLIESVKLLYALVIDLNTSITIEKLRRSFGAWLAPGCIIDTKVLDAEISKADELIIAYLHMSADSWSLGDFKHHLGTAFAISMIVRDVIIDYLRQQDHHSFKVLHNFYSFLKRLTVDVDISFVDEWLDQEDKMHEWQYDDRLLDDLNAIMREQFPGKAPVDFFMPKNGPGATFEMPRPNPSFGTVSQLKYQHFTADSMLRYVINKCCGPIESWVPMQTLASGVPRTNRIIEVPKGLFKRRVISAEPASLAYFQQGVASMIRYAIDQSSVFSKYIDLRDQSKSQKMAQYGSIVGDLATIDLSMASDSVTWTLVKRVFRGTWLLPFLAATRSYHSVLKRREPGTGNDETIYYRHVAKFAPMGSAVCFPIETLVFASICELCRRRAKAPIRHGRLVAIRVYGDDIIVPQGIYDNVVEMLDSLHFRVNETKTFSGYFVQNFRESCGGEYLNGIPVTPLRIPRFYKGFYNEALRSSPECCAAQIAFANQALQHGCRYVRRVLLDGLRQTVVRVPRHRKMKRGQRTDMVRTTIGINDLPFSEDGSFGLETEEVFGEWQYDPNLQRHYKPVYMVRGKIRKPRDISDDVFEYLLYWESLRQGRYRQIRDEHHVKAQTETIYDDTFSNVKRISDPSKALPRGASVLTWSKGKQYVD